MSKAKLVRRAIRRLLLAAPTVPIISMAGCGPIEVKTTDPLTNAIFADGGRDTSTDCHELCTTIHHLGTSNRIVACSFATADGGVPGVFCDYTIPAEGRKPPGTVAWERVAAGHPAGVLFAAAAQLEAASVHAFRTLARELSAHRAPIVLVQAALRSAREEAAHTAAMTRLAWRYDANVAAPRVPATPVRTLEEIAADNAGEGCVRETHGALVAAWQARRAADPVVRKELRAIAADEMRHAELAWRIAEWIEPKLSSAGRRRLARIRAGAAETELEASGTRPHASWVSIAGLPDADTARRMTAALASELWSVAA